MPSNDERREVAARLRDYIDFDFEDSNPYWYAMKAVYGDVAIHDDNELFSRLADLIEPEERTCRRITHGLGRDRAVATVSYTCSECGAHIGGDHKYCHECGFRVEEER